MQDLIMQLVLGGLLGVTGQGIRTLIGLKKLSEQASAAGRDAHDLFTAHKLLMSLFVGFVTGSVASVLVEDFGRLVAMPAERNRLIALLMASGYAGTDFLEGALSRLPVGPWSQLAATSVVVPASADAVSQRVDSRESNVPKLEPPATSQVNVEILATLKGEGQLDVHFGGVPVALDAAGRGVVSATRGNTYDLQWFVSGAKPNAILEIAVVAPAAAAYHSGKLQASGAGTFAAVRRVNV